LAILAILALLPLVASPGTALAQNDRAPRIPPGKWRPNGAPEGWQILVAGSYQVQSEVEPVRAAAVIRHVQAMMGEYHSRFYIRKPLKDFVLKIFADRDGYTGYGGSPGSLAYYSGYTKELVCFDTGSLAGNDSTIDNFWFQRLLERLTAIGLPSELAENAEVKLSLGLLARPQLLGVLAHEGWHQYFHFWIVSQVEFPSWLDEGLGDYFYTAQVSEDGKTVTCGLLNPMRFPTIWLAIKNGRHVPIREILRYRQRDYYANASLCYAEGWALVYFCFHSGNPRYEKIPETLIRAFKDNHDMDEATDIAFRRIDLDKFEREWIDFYMAMDFRSTLKGMVKDLLGIEVEAVEDPLTTPEPKPTGESPEGPEEKPEGGEDPPPGGGAHAGANLLPKAGPSRTVS